MSTYVKVGNWHNLFPTGMHVKHTSKLIMNCVQTRKVKQVLKLLLYVLKIRI